MKSKNIYITLLLLFICSVSIVSKNKEKYLPVEIKTEGCLMKYWYDNKNRIIKSTVNASNDSLYYFSIQEQEYTRNDLLKTVKYDIYYKSNEGDTIHVNHLYQYRYVLESDSLLLANVKKNTYYEEGGSDSRLIDMTSVIKYYLDKAGRVYKIQEISDDDMMIETDVKYDEAGNIYNAKIKSSFSYDSITNSTTIDSTLTHRGIFDDVNQKYLQQGLFIATFQNQCPILKRDVDMDTVSISNYKYDFDENNYPISFNSTYSSEDIENKDAKEPAESAFYYIKYEKVRK